MSVTSTDNLLSALGASVSQQHPFNKQGSLTGKAGFWSSIWTTAGRPAAGATPVAFNHSPNGGEVPTSATTGAIIFTDPGGSNVLYLSNLSAEAIYQGASNTLGLTFMIADRLWQCSGISGTSVSLQSISGTPAALTRPDANGNGAEIWVETYANGGATAQTLTITYTNQSGGNSRTATAKLPTNFNQSGLCQPATLQAGDTGVQSIQSVQFGGSTGTAGNYGITILRRIAEVQTNICTAAALGDMFYDNLPILYAGACIGMYVQCPGGSEPLFYTGNVMMAEG